jgi:hypothetical protein
VTRHPAARLVVLVLTVVATAAASVLPAGAVIPRSAFPTTVEVKTTLNGVGEWRSAWYGDTTALGARPPGCRSDRQMLAFTEDRGKVYLGRQRGLPVGVEALAKIDVYRYASPADARAAVARNATYADRCPRVVEWVCTDCDGIWTTWRTSVEAARVGQQSTAWSWRELGNAKATGYTIVARRGDAVVKVSVGRQRFPGVGAFTYPALIAKKKAVAVARLALSAAT